MLHSTVSPLDRLLAHVLSCVSLQCHCSCVPGARDVSKASLLWAYLLWLQVAAKGLACCGLLAWSWQPEPAPAQDMVMEGGEGVVAQEGLALRALLEGIMGLATQKAEELQFSGEGGGASLANSSIVGCVVTGFGLRLLLRVAFGALGLEHPAGLLEGEV